MDWSKHGYRVTSPYGMRSDPFNGNQVMHSGIDLVKAHKASISTFVSGEVVHAREGQEGTGFGNYGIVVAVKDESGSLHCYCHLDSCSVIVGQRVSVGQELGKQGTTGRSTASHLHYEVRTKASPSYGYGCHTDPGAYLDNYMMEGDDELKLDNNQQKMLIETLTVMEKKKLIDKVWVEKASKSTLTVSELTWLNTIVIARK